MPRVFNHYFLGRKAALFLAETGAMSLLCALGASATLATRPWKGAAVLAAVAFAATLQLCLYMFDLYDLRVAREDRAQGVRMLKATGMAAVAIGVGAAFLGLRSPPGVLMGGALGALFGTALVRTALKGVVGEPDRVLVVGDGVRARAVIKAVEEGAEGAFCVVGKVEPHRTADEGEGRPTLLELARGVEADYVVAAADEPRGAVWTSDLLACRLEGLRVYDVAGFFERVLRRIPVAHLRGSELAFCDEVRPTATRRFAKRAFDLLMALMLLLGAGPWMVLVALAIRLDSKGPVFYRQERVGQGGRRYWLWKFRSMRVDAEKYGAVWARANDERVTRVGRFIRKSRLDELPQVFNVLWGQMSLVGPRPERPVFVEQLRLELPFYALREAVKPGITGWAQIRYPYGASVEDARNKLELDLYYLKNQSFFLDLIVTFHTVRHVLFGRGAR
jgi:sugar transferase (PEP-CTERM system associated)